MEDEPEVEQPDHAEQQLIHQQLLLDDDDEDEMADDVDVDDDDEDDETDISQLHDVSIRDALNAVVKDEIFNHDQQPMAKKSEFIDYISHIFFIFIRYHISLYWLYLIFNIVIIYVYV